MCSLLGFATNPKKDADNATKLTILGVKVVVDTLKQTIAAAVDENNATQWSETFKSILESKVCSPDQAAECAGRLGFACTIAFGHIGRAIVKLFYAQSHASLVNFTLSPSLANAAEWWIKFL